MFNGMDFDNNQFIYRLRCRFCGTFQFFKNASYIIISRIHGFRLRFCDII